MKSNEEVAELRTHDNDGKGHNDGQNVYFHDGVVQCRKQNKKLA